MNVTPRESQAARALAEALLEFLVAHETAATSRQQSLARAEVRTRVDAPPATSSLATKPSAELEVKPTNALLVDSKEAARMLSLGARSLWSLTAPRGPIPSVRIGTAVRYSVSSLEEFVKRTEVRRR